MEKKWIFLVLVCSIIAVGSVVGAADPAAPGLAAPPGASAPVAGTTYTYGAYPYFSYYVLTTGAGYQTFPTVPSYLRFVIDDFTATNAYGANEYFYVFRGAPGVYSYVDLEYVPAYSTRSHPFKLVLNAGEQMKIFAPVTNQHFSIVGHYETIS